MLISSLESKSKRSAIFKVKILDGENKLFTEGLIEYFIYPENIAKKKFHYPGLSTFFAKK